MDKLKVFSIFLGIPRDVHIGFPPLRRKQELFERFHRFGNIFGARRFKLGAVAEAVKNADAIKSAPRRPDNIIFPIADHHRMLTVDPGVFHDEPGKHLPFFDPFAEIGAHKFRRNRRQVRDSP